MSADDPTLADLRREIDEIDIAIHDLIMRRSDLVARIGAAKGDGQTFMRPGREAQVVRRLIERHRGSFPKPVLARIWREIISVFTGLQGPFAAAVYVPESGASLEGLARDHFGSLTPITAFGSEMGVLRAVTDKQATVGVLPLPETGEDATWWPNMAGPRQDTPRVVARLPFASQGAARAKELQALVVALARQEESGEDRSFLLVESNEALSRGALKILLEQSGFVAFEMQLRDEVSGHSLHLVEVDGFVAEDDSRLARLVKIGDPTIAQAWAVGSYAVPLSAEALAPSGSQT